MRKHISRPCSEIQADSGAAGFKSIIEEGRDENLNAIHEPYAIYRLRLLANQKSNLCDELMTVLIDASYPQQSIL
jgi:hypothetical protein